MHLTIFLAATNFHEVTLENRLLQFSEAKNIPLAWLSTVYIEFNKLLINKNSLIKIIFVFTNNYLTIPDDKIFWWHQKIFVNILKQINYI